MASVKVVLVLLPQSGFVVLLGGVGKPVGPAGYVALTELIGTPEVAVPDKTVADDVVESVAEVVTGSTEIVELEVFTGSVVEAGSVTNGNEVVALALLTGAPDEAGAETFELGTEKPPDGKGPVPLEPGTENPSEGAAGAPPAQ